MLQVGQKLYWVPSQKGHMDEREVEVEKVGRKWASIASGRYRIDIDTLRADGGNYSSPGCCYLDRDAFLAKRAAKRAWDTLRQKMGFYPPAGVGETAILQAMQLLKVSPFNGLRVVRLDRSE